MYNVYCIMYIVQCTLYIHCITYDVYHSATQIDGVAEQLSMKDGECTTLKEKLSESSNRVATLEFEITNLKSHIDASDFNARTKV